MTVNNKKTLLSSFLMSFTLLLASHALAMKSARELFKERQAMRLKLAANPPLPIAALQKNPLESLHIIEDWNGETHHQHNTHKSALASSTAHTAAHKQSSTILDPLEDPENWTQIILPLSPHTTDSHHSHEDITASVKIVGGMANTLLEGLQRLHQELWDQLYKEAAFYHSLAHGKAGNNLSLSNVQQAHLETAKRKFPLLISILAQQYDLASQRFEGKAEPIHLQNMTFTQAESLLITLKQQGPLTFSLADLLAINAGFRKVSQSF